MTRKMFIIDRECAENNIGWVACQMGLEWPFVVGVKAWGAWKIRTYYPIDKVRLSE